MSQAKSDDSRQLNRREFISSVTMWSSLTAAFGLFGIQGVMYLFPNNLTIPTRKVYAGNLNQYEVGAVQTFHDLQGGEILVRRTEGGFQAFSNVCPHLGCRVHWEEENSHFFCPCHNGIFNEDGVATAGPPADDKQNLPAVPVVVDEESGVVYLEVKDTDNA